MRSKLTLLLQSAAHGVAKNPTAGPADVMTFVFATLQDGLAAEEAARERAAAEAEAAMPRSGKFRQM